MKDCAPCWLLTNNTGNRMGFRLALLSLLLLFSCDYCFSQSTFAGNAQHTSSYRASAKNLSSIKWTAPNDLNNTGALAHYGSPLVTASNTVVVPVKIAGNAFRVDAFDGLTGTPKYALQSDYILPSSVWIPSYNICITTGSFGTRLYYAGAGGTVWHVDNPDSSTPGTPVREVFYSSLAGYNANAAAYNGTIFINTPITADSAGNIYFGFRVQGMAPAPLSTTQSGFVRIDTNGIGTYVLAGTAANDVTFSLDSHNLAPALSNDENTLYVVAKAGNSSGYLLGLNPATLATKFSVFLRDPRNGNAALISDNGTSSPMVGPDGDVYLGVLANPGNGSRGFLLHFNADLSVVKTPGAFGWDYTPGVVPANLVPSYTGSSTYLLFCKYNDYAIADGSGVNRVALLDPNDTQIDPHTSATALVEMREVLTIIGPTPDSGASGFVDAVKEWCINAPAVNPSTNSVFFDSEDGHLYRWSLITNSLDQAVTLNEGIGQPYVPTVIGPDGTIYTLNGGNFFALGNTPGVDITITSSSPDLRNTVAGTSLTFVATISGGVAVPTGTVTFTDFTYNGFTPVTTILATNVSVDGNGHASVTTSSLTAGASFLGNHFITATYSGDQGHPASSVTMMQKVHANASSTSLSSSANPANAGSGLAFTATVSSTAGVTGVPTGMVTFRDGSVVIGQVPLNPAGVATITKSDLRAGVHSVSATYASDTRFAASSGTVSQVIEGTSVRFSQTTFIVSEGSPSVTLMLTRTGDTTVTSSVSYRTVDTDNFTIGCSDVVNNQSAAYGRCDFATTTDTLMFAPGDITKSISVPIINDSLAEGDETFSIELTGAIGATLGSPATATVVINDNETMNGANPIFITSFFVRQHYLDFLSREPEAGEPWSVVLNNCSDVNNNPACDRLTVSAAFFGSPEFRLKGYFVYRFYRLAFNRLPTYPEMVNDMRAVTGQTPNEVFQKKSAFASVFAQRTEFTSTYLFMTNMQYVTALMNRYGLSQITAPDPAAPDGINKMTFTTTELANQLNATVLTRAQVLRAIADSDQVFNAEFNQAFVAMQYFGYLRRAPDTAGYNAWLDYLNTHPADSRTMVNGFVNSAEYRLRFGP